MSDRFSQVSFDQNYCIVWLDEGLMLGINTTNFNDIEIFYRKKGWFKKWNTINTDSSLETLKDIKNRLINCSGKSHRMMKGHLPDEVISTFQLTALSIMWERIRRYENPDPIIIKNVLEESPKINHLQEYNKLKKEFDETEFKPKEIKKDRIVADEVPVTIVIKRLEILKNYILLEAEEEINKSTLKLNEYIYYPEIISIIDYSNKGAYSDVIDKIHDFISNYQKVSIWSDPEIDILKLKIKKLEKHITELSNEKIDLEKLISDFNHRQTIELSEIILDLLKLRKAKFKNDKQKYEEAERDEKQYSDESGIERERELFSLNQLEKAELKSKYRRATTYCHPDKFVNESQELQKQAEDIFKELNEANRKNDIQRVREILANLEKGILTTIAGDNLSDKEKLRSTINALQLKVRKLESEIESIKENVTFKEIIAIENWDDYFSMTKTKLKEELERLNHDF